MNSKLERKLNRSIREIKIRGVSERLLAKTDRDCAFDWTEPTIGMIFGDLSTQQIFEFTEQRRN